MDESGSTFLVPVTKVINIRPHPNPKVERLEIAKILGFESIVPKGTYQIGELVVYIPVDGILPASIEEKLFANSKIKLFNSRIRACKIQGFVSEGLVAKPESLGILKPIEGKDYKVFLQIIKHQPPEKNIQGMKSKVNKVNLKDHPLFHSYNGLSRIQWQEDLFQEGELISAQEKLHGTNARYSILPYTVDTLWRKLLKLLKLTPEFEKNYGSNNVQISRKFGYKGFYGSDVYGDTGKREQIFDKLKPNEIIYGEIIGPGIQKGYSYGLTKHTFVLFDVKVYCPIKKEMKWMNPEEVSKFCIERSFLMVPTIFEGPFNRDLVGTLAEGFSIFNPNEKVREGVVIKSMNDYNSPLAKSDRKALKVMNPAYLLDTSNSDEH